MKEREFKVILEDIEQKFNLVMDQLSPMREDIDVIKKDVAQLKEDMIVVKASLKNKADVSRVEALEKALNI